MLETVAAIPPYITSSLHHMRSLRNMRHCQWIKASADEAENERMHLMTFMELAEPTKFQRFLIVATQGTLMGLYTPFLIIAPRVAHRFVGYLEEEACHTYTEMLQMIDAGELENVPAPQVAIDYWGLPSEARLREVVLVVRADEADHRLSNHFMSDRYMETKKKTDEEPCEEMIDMHTPFQSQDEQRYAGGKPKPMV
jgi:ubiquinol oxidase